MSTKVCVFQVEKDGLVVSCQEGEERVDYRGVDFLYPWPNPSARGARTSSSSSSSYKVSEHIALPRGKNVRQL